MLSPDDLKAIGALLDQKLADYPTKAYLDEKLSQYPTKIDLEKLFKASEGRMDSKLQIQKTDLLVEMSKLGKELLDKMDEQRQELFNKMGDQREELIGALRQQKKEIVNEISDLLHKSLLPLFDKHEKRLEHLERHTIHPPGSPVDS